MARNHVPFLLLLLLLFSSSSSSLQTLLLESFTNPPLLFQSGSFFHNGALVLTKSERNQLGYAFFADSLPLVSVGKGFVETKINFVIDQEGGFDEGGDGFVFMVSSLLCPFFFSFFFFLVLSSSFLVLSSSFLVLLPTFSLILSLCFSPHRFRRVFLTFVGEWPPLKTFVPPIASGSRWTPSRTAKSEMEIILG